MLFNASLPLGRKIKKKTRQDDFSRYYIPPAYFCTERFKNETWVLIIAAEKNHSTL